MAESRMLRDGMEAALNAGYSTIEVEGDNSLVIAAVKGEIGGAWRIKTVICDIQQLFTQAPNSKLTPVYQEANLSSRLAVKIRPLHHRYMDKC